MSRQIQQNQSRLISCPECNNKLTASKVKNHIGQCKKYVTTYVNNVDRFIDDMGSNYLEFLAAEMDIIKEKIMDKLEIQRKLKSQGKEKYGEKSHEKSNSKHGINSNQGGQKDIKNSQKKQEKIQIKQKIERIQIKEPQLQRISKTGTLLLDEDYNDQIFKQIKQKQLIECAYPKCTSPAGLNNIQLFLYLDECLHTICKFCFRDYIRNNYVKQSGEVRCPQKDCEYFIPSIQIRQIVDGKVMQKLDNQVNGKLIDIVQCVKCHENYQFQKGKASDAPKKTQEGKAMSTSMAKHYAQNRFNCTKCRSQQCKTCKAIPYHLGFNCEEFKDDKLKKKCRYCHTILPKGYMSETGIKAFDDICDSQECRSQTKEACSKILKCGHACYGYIRQKSCIPCLNETCAREKSEELRGQHENSFCSLCYVETLGEAPCVRSKCGHIFHFKCLKKRLDMKWDTARITFKFCECPLCSKWLEIPQESPLSKLLLEYNKLYEKIKEKALKRLGHEKQDKNEQLKDQKSLYYKNPEKLALTIFAYFQCYQCHEPYFGGRKSCAEAMSEDRQNKEFNPKELICPGCCPQTLVNDCKKHGKEFVSYKCRFCCEIAQWFCWGNAHFCDKCHQRQINGGYVSRIPKDKLPKCQGKQKCPVGGGHAQNGQQYCLGCAICRQQKLQPNDF